MPEQVTSSREDLADQWTLITVSFNSSNVLKSAWRDADLTGVRWIVVDNNSQDDSVSVAKSLGAEVIARDTNAGFGSSNNVGLTQVTSPWTAFVNPDVTFDRSSLPRLAALSVANNALVAPQLVYPGGEQQANARGLPTPAAKLSNRGVRVPRIDSTAYARTHLQSPTYVAWLMGAVVCGATDAFRRIGGWDDRFFIYYEDHEIGLRAWEAGMSVVIDPQTTWSHEWQRETTTLSRSAWKAELASARTFYGLFPDLLTRGRATRSKRFSRIRTQLWTEAVDV